MTMASGELQCRMAFFVGFKPLSARSECLRSSEELRLRDWSHVKGGVVHHSSGRTTLLRQPESLIRLAQHDPSRWQVCNELRDLFASKPALCQFRIGEIKEFVSHCSLMAGTLENHQINQNCTKWREKRLTPDGWSVECGNSRHKDTLSISRPPLHYEYDIATVCATIFFAWHNCACQIASLKQKGSFRGRSGNAACNHRPDEVKPLEIRPTSKCCVTSDSGLWGVFAPRQWSRDPSRLAAPCRVASLRRGGSTRFSSRRNSGAGVHRSGPLRCGVSGSRRCRQSDSRRPCIALSG